MWWFRAGLIGLSLTELLVLTQRFDAQALVDSGAWWGQLAGLARYGPQGLVAAAAVALVFGLARGGRVGEVADRPRWSAWSWVYLAAHLVSFGVLVVLTGAVLEGPAGRSAAAPIWVAAWLAVGLATGLLCLAALLGPSAWLGLLRRGTASGVLPAAAAAGAGACLALRFGRDLWGPLGAATLWSVRGLLGLVFSDVAFDPAASVVGARGFLVEVAPECSGCEGIGLIWVFLAVHLWVFRRTLRFPRAFWLVPLGTVLIWLANVGRIAALVALGATISPEVALGGFHSQAGWIAFNGVALGLVAAGRWSRVFNASSTDADADAGAALSAGPSPTVAHLGPFLALMAATMLTGALGPAAGLDLLYPARVVAVGAVLWLLRDGHRREGQVRGGAWSWSWSALAVGAGVFAIWLALERSYTTPEQAGRVSAEMAEALARLPRGLALAWLVVRVVGSVVTVPIAEELAFRGYLTRRLVSADFTQVAPGRMTFVSFLLSSVVFGYFHGRFLAGCLAGMAYALVYRRRGRLSDAVLAHATTNALIAADVLATGAWSLWA